MRLRFEIVSHTGLVRTQNEDMAYAGGQTVRDDSDAFEFDIPQEGMKFGAVVCDGLGGREGGEKASALTCNMFDTFVDDLPVGLEPNDLILRLKRWAQTANDAIMAESHGNSMATTLTGLLLYFGQAYILNCGDSRTYRLRYGNFRQLTRDHSERNRLNDPSAPANLMYNCLGIPEAFIDITPTKVVEGDQYIICSDGLSDYVSEAEMQTNIHSAQALVDAALGAGAPDNVTVITLKFT